MENYVIATCSTADISLNHMLRIGVEYVKFSYFLNDVEYKDDLGQTMSHESFYQKLSQGCDSKTTQPNMESYKAATVKQHSLIWKAIRNFYINS